jgi:hypothetical protein
VVRKFTIPGEDSIGRGNDSNLFQGFLTQLGANLSEVLALTVCQPHPTIDLPTQDAILGYQIVIAKPQVVAQGC